MDLIKDVNVYYLNKMQVKRMPMALFMTGSRLHNLATDSSDYDVVMLVEETLDDLLLNKTFVKDYQFTCENKNVDLKVMDFRHLYKLILQANPTILEVLSANPIWTNAEAPRHNKLVFQLLNKDGRKNLRYVNQERYLKAINGMLKNNLKQLQAQKDRSLKDISLMQLYVEHAKDIILHRRWFDIDETKSKKVYDLRQAYDNNKLTFDQAIEINHKLDIEMNEIIIPHANAKYDPDSREKAITFFKINFAKAILDFN